MEHCELELESLVAETVAEVVVEMAKVALHLYHATTSTITINYYTNILVAGNKAQSLFAAIKGLVCK